MCPGLSLEMGSWHDSACTDECQDGFQAKLVHAGKGDKKILKEIRVPLDCKGKKFKAHAVRELLKNIAP